MRATQGNKGLPDKLDTAASTALAKVGAMSDAFQLFEKGTMSSRDLAKASTEARGGIEAVWDILERAARKSLKSLSKFRAVAPDMKRRVHDAIGPDALHRRAKVCPCCMRCCVWLPGAWPHPSPVPSRTHGNQAGVRGALDSLGQVGEEEETLRAALEKGSDSHRGLDSDVVANIVSIVAAARKIANEFATGAALLNKRDAAAIASAQVRGHATTRQFPELDA